MDSNSSGEQNKKNFLNVIIVVVLLVAFFVGGVLVGSKGNTDVAALSFFSDLQATQPANVDFAPLWKAWSVLNEKYVAASSTEVVLDKDRLWGAIEGLAGSLGDPYTVFLPPADAELFEEDIRGNFGGVGMEIGIRDGVLTVIAPLKGTPADKAGILSGDIVVKIDDEFTDKFSIDQSVGRIRGEVGTAVVLTVARESEDDFLEIEIVRDIIEIPTIDSELRDDGIYTIALYNFSAISSGLFRDALRSFVETGSNKLILDLRGNPGGFLEASVDMASWFLPAGKLVVEEDFGDNEKPRAHRSKGYDIFSDSLEMVVLVNQGSASASEILAGALKAHGIATLVGATTFGKGSVQELVKITSDTSLKVTVARWLTPEGVSISDGGLTPDVEVEVTPEDIEEEIDPQLEKAVEILLSK